MGLKTYLFNRLDSRKFRLNGIHPSHRLPTKQKLCQAFRDHVLYSANQLPQKVDLRNDMTPVEDQSKIGSCAANCLAGAYEYLTKKSNGRNTDVSRLFIYFNSRAKEHGSRALSDSGCSMTSAIEALEEFGTCLESIWPYNISEVNVRPSQEAFEEAKHHKITEALQVDINLEEMKSCLAQGFPFAFGLKLFKSFDKASSTGAVPMPDGSGGRRASHGSHALLAVGYSDNSQSFIVRNSWGEDWGDRGYCYIPYGYMTNPEFCFDAWAVRKLANDNFSKDHWDNVDSVNYLKAAIIELISMDNLGSNHGDDCCIAEVDEDDGSNKSGKNPISHAQSNQWSNNQGWDDQQQNAGNNYPGNSASAYFDQHQQYSGGDNHYQGHPQWNATNYQQYGTNYQGNNNYSSQYQDPYQANFPGTNPNYDVQPNSSYYPPYGSGPTNQSNTYQPTLADIMNASDNGNQRQGGTGYPQYNNQFNYPGQYDR